MKVRNRLIRIAAGGTCALLAFSAAAPSGHADTATPPAPSPTPATPAASAAGSITLNGEGAADPAGEIKTWQNDLYGNSGTINLDYIQTGGYRARQDLISGAIDYAVSGVPFTSQELAKLPKGSASLIDAPVMASGLGVIVDPPRNLQAPGEYGWGLLNIDANGNGTYHPYTGPIKVPALNLAAMLFNYQLPAGSTDQGIPLNRWDNPRIVSAFGLTTKPLDANGNNGIAFDPSEVPLPFLRSDPSETDYYSELLASTAAPAVWQGLEKAKNTTYTVADALPPTIDAVRTSQGLSTQLDQLGKPVSGVIVLPISGSPLVAVPPAAMNLYKATAPTTLAQWVNVQNANGEWVAPSPASIDAAVNAGGDTPLYALNHPVAGGYPFSYVNHIYAPAHGLSVDKTEAIATTIRYLATDGQGAMEANGDGKLSAKLTAQALAAANQLVLSNCIGPGANLITSSDPGRLAPPLPGLKAIGSMLHCDPPAGAQPGASGSAPSAPAIPTATGFVPTTSADASTAGGATSAGGGTTAGAAAGSGGPGKPAGKSGAAPNKALTLASLPIPLPFSGVVTFDRLAALLIGAVFFFLGRRVVAWLVRLTRP